MPKRKRWSSAIKEGRNEIYVWTDAQNAWAPDMSGPIRTVKVRKVRDYVSAEEYNYFCQRNHVISEKGGSSRGRCEEIEPASGRWSSPQLELGGTLAWPPGGSAGLA